MPGLLFVFLRSGLENPKEMKERSFHVPLVSLPNVATQKEETQLSNGDSVQEPHFQRDPSVSPLNLNLSNPNLEALGNLCLHNSASCGWQVLGTCNPIRKHPINFMIICSSLKAR